MMVRTYVVRFLEFLLVTMTLALLLWLADMAFDAGWLENRGVNLAAASPFFSAGMAAFSLWLGPPPATRPGRLTSGE
jgi:hypothetical protein